MPVTPPSLFSLFLIGPRGAGKSAAGARAAAAAGCPFVDVDLLAEQRAGVSVARIFAEQGEPAFRALERKLMLELLDPGAQPGLVATGGGCVVDAEVRAGLRGQPGVLWLDGAADVLRARIAGSDRPSLTGAGSPGEELAFIATQRRPHYEACSRRTLDTTTLTVEEAADVVQQFWTELSRHDLR